MSHLKEKEWGEQNEVYFTKNIHTAYKSANVSTKTDNWLKQNMSQKKSLCGKDHQDICTHDYTSCSIQDGIGKKNK